ncbi:hypothetical protein [[Eubacterium] cellulosolvens]
MELDNKDNLIDIDLLRPHEQIDPIRLEKIKRQLIRDGIQREPIIIEGNHLIVLDGHHRIRALKELGYSKVVAHKINYSQGDLILKTWYPVIKGSKKELQSTLHDHITSSDSKQILLRCPRLIMYDKEHQLKNDRKTIMDSILGKFGIKYVRNEEKARELARHDNFAGSIIFESIEKEDVIKAALSGSILPPKTTQHIIPCRPEKCFIPLEKLGKCPHLKTTSDLK